MQKKKIITCITILIFVFVVSFTGLAKAEDYKVGTIWPMTGTAAAFGEAITNACTLVQDYVNEAGGIHGNELKIINRDTGSEPTKGVDAARKLINVNKVPAIVGCYSSGVAMGVSQGVTIPNEAVFVTLGTSPMISVVKDNDYFFRASAHDLYNGRVLGEAMYNDGHREIGIVYVNNAYGKGIADAAAVTFSKIHDGKVVAKVPFEIGKSSYSSEIRRTYQNGDIDATLIIAYPEDATVMHKEIYANGWDDIPWYGSPDQKVPELIDSLGAEYMEGIVLGSTQGRWPGASKDSFMEGYNKKYGEYPPKPYMAPGFDGLVSVVLAIARSGKAPGEVTGQDVRDNIRAVTSEPGEKIYATVEGFKKAFALLEEGKEINYIGASGNVEYDKYGDAMSAIQTWTIEDGEIITIENIIPDPVPRELMPPEYQVE
ncbi:MAG TPA: ABC transporter substrate-binding protein [Clostridia bacterium]|nr:ABC transporter substrate-binding protein [Clostridia bacterium]